MELTKAKQLREMFRAYLHEAYYSDSWDMSTSEANEYLDRTSDDFIEFCKQLPIKVKGVN